MRHHFPRIAEVEVGASEVQADSPKHRPLGLRRLLASEYEFYVNYEPVQPSAASPRTSLQVPTSSPAFVSPLGQGAWIQLRAAAIF